MDISKKKTDYEIENAKEKLIQQREAIQEANKGSRDRQFICKQSCYHNHTWFEKGEIYEEWAIGEQIPQHFEVLNSSNAKAYDPKNITDEFIASGVGHSRFTGGIR